MSKALCLDISHPFHAAHRVMALQTFLHRFVKQLPSLPAAQRGLALLTSLHRFVNQCTKAPTVEIGYRFQWPTVPSRERCYNVVLCNTVWCSFVQFSPGPVALIPPTETTCQEGGLLTQKKNLIRLQIGGRQHEKSSTRLYLGEGRLSCLSHKAGPCRSYCSLEGTFVQ